MARNLDQDYQELRLVDQELRLVDQELRLVDQELRLGLLGAQIS